MKRNKHLQEAMARYNRSTMECAIDDCRDMIEGLILEKFNANQTKRIMGYIDHLCNFRVVQASEMSGMNRRDAVGNIVVEYGRRGRHG